MLEKDLFDLKGLSLEDWEKLKSYKVGDLVVYKYSIYECKVAHANRSTTPLLDTSYWDVFVGASVGTGTIQYMIPLSSSNFEAYVDGGTNNPSINGGAILGWSNYNVIRGNLKELPSSWASTNKSLRVPSGLWTISACWDLNDLSDTQPASFASIYLDDELVSTQGFYAEVGNSYDAMDANSLISNFTFRVNGLYSMLRINVTARFFSRPTLYVFLSKIAP